MSENTADRALNACADLEFCHAEVKRIQAAIREQFEACEGAQYVAHVEAGECKAMFHGDEWPDCSHRPTRHLDAARDACTRDQGPEMPDFADPNDIADELARTCRYCSRAWALMKERKAARKRLTSAKLRVRWAGKAALRERLP